MCNVRVALRTGDEYVLQYPIGTPLSAVKAEAARLLGGGKVGIRRTRTATASPPHSKLAPYPLDDGRLCFEFSVEAL